MGIRPIIANSTPINNKIRIQIMSNNELQLYTTYDMQYTKRLDTIMLPDRLAEPWLAGIKDCDKIWNSRR